MKVIKNIYDADSCLETVKEFKENACVIVKHANPCGVSENKNLLQAYTDARDCDPVSAFGGIVSCNYRVNKTVAKELSKLFLEVVIGNNFDGKGFVKAKPQGIRDPRFKY